MIAPRIQAWGDPKPFYGRHDGFDPSLGGQARPTLKLPAADRRQVVNRLV
jgi:hypothetical protein